MENSTNLISFQMKHSLILITIELFQKLNKQNYWVIKSSQFSNYLILLAHKQIAKGAMLLDNMFF